MVVHDHHEYLCQEEQRLKEDKERTKYWKKWGPYTAERQWATGAQRRSTSYDLTLTYHLSPRRLLVSSRSSVGSLVVILTRNEGQTEMLGVVSALQGSLQYQR